MKEYGQGFKTKKQLVFARTLAPKIRPKSYCKDAKQEIAFWGGAPIKAVHIYQLVTAYPAIRRLWSNLYKNEKFPADQTMGRLGGIIKAYDLSSEKLTEHLRNKWYDKPENYPTEPPIVVLSKDVLAEMVYDDELEQAMR